MAERRLADTQRIAGIGCWEWDVRTDTVVWSDELYRILGFVPAAFVPTYQGYLDLLEPADAQAVRDAVGRALDGGGGYVLDSPLALPDGSVRRLRARGEAVCDPAGVPVRIVGTVQDITELTEATDALLRERRFLAAVVDNLKGHLLACDAHGNVTVFNAATAAILGLSPGYWTRDQWVELRRLLHADGTAMSFEEEPLLRCLRGEDVTGVEISVAPRRGRRHTMIVSGDRLVDADGVTYGAVLTMHDVTEQRKTQASLEDAATRDSLTGLPTRTLFVDRATQALRRCRRQHRALTLLSIDIDHFSDLNARLGSATADRVLVEVAARLLRTVRSYDSVTRNSGAAARVGGDEFLLLCEQLIDDTKVPAIAARVARAIEEPMILDGVTVTVTASMGITVSDGEAEASALVLQAEAAMHRAKEGDPGSREFFDQTLRAQLARREGIERDLRTAIERHELRLHYQPKVALITEKIVGIEALLRWHHPERGLVAPDEFIAIAEDAGLIVPIGRWVLEEACGQAQEWRARFPDQPLLVSVNVSARQFDTDLVSVVQSALAQTGMDPAQLCLEITESIVMRDVASAVETLRSLKALGVKLSVDDFGTGYSSLAYLRRFPLDELKVDKSFIDGLGTDPDATAIVAAVVATAHALGLTVVAEGVETSAQLAALRALGCELVQGYHFFRPQSAAIVSQWLAEDSEARAVPERDGSRGGDRAKVRHTQVALVVDDAADVRRLAQMSLAASGFEVHEAESGETALTLIASLHPDCIVLDVNLPGISGLEICRQLRDDPAHDDITVVMLSGDGTARDKALAFSLAADEYIVKPFAPRDLVARVQAAMRRRHEDNAAALLTTG